MIAAIDECREAEKDKHTCAHQWRSQPENLGGQNVWF